MTVLQEGSGAGLRTRAVQGERPKTRGIIANPPGACSSPRSSASDRLRYGVPGPGFRVPGIWG